jgi:hypothetical protein
MVRRARLECGRSWVHRWCVMVRRARLECGRSWVHRWDVMVSVLASSVVDRGFIGGMQWLACSPRWIGIRISVRVWRHFYPRTVVSVS